MVWCCVVWVCGVVVFMGDFGLLDYGLCYFEALIDYIGWGTGDWDLRLRCMVLFGIV
jgi:hypothetical protein